MIPEIKYPKSQFSNNRNILQKYSNYLYIFFESEEDRAKVELYPSKYIRLIQDVYNRDNYIVRLDTNTNCTENTINIRDQNQVLKLFGKFSNRIILDITELPYHIWVPMVNYAKKKNIDLKICYAEPSEYSKAVSVVPPGQIFNLSERTRGLAPIHGFCRISSDEEEDFILVPLLGFEGSRTYYIYEQINPIRKNVFPIIPAPGYKIEYPSLTYHCNKDFFETSKSWNNVHYSTSNCPFNTYDTLSNIHADNKNKLMKIALVGTRPHSLGAVLYAIDYSNHTELLFDHPVSSKERSKGLEKVHIYDINNI